MKVRLQLAAHVHKCSSSSIIHTSTAVAVAMSAAKTVPVVFYSALPRYKHHCRSPKTHVQISRKVSTLMLELSFREYTLLNTGFAEKKADGVQPGYRKQQEPLTLRMLEKNDERLSRTVKRTTGEA